MAKTRSAEHAASVERSQTRIQDTVNSGSRTPFRQNVRGDLQSKRMILVKGGLFLLLGCLSGGLLLSSILTLRNLILFGLTIWSFCRCYYFAFYVIEHYVDPSYRYRGLIDLAKHYWTRRR